jgi:hypothetical protein
VLYTLHKGHKRHRGDDDSVGTASVTAQSDKLKASIRAWTTSGDVDDDKTVNSSNQRVTHRNNSALAEDLCLLSL